MSEAKHSPLMDCPFCGSSRIEDLEHLDWVCCQDCGASLEDVEPNARALWNTRAKARIEALEAQLADAEVTIDAFGKVTPQQYQKEIDTLRAQLAAAREAQFLISRPYIGAWTDEVIIEAAHQRDRHGAEHDHGQNPEDWFWLIGYLAGKCLAAHKSGDIEKARHHTVSTGAVLAHWAATISGDESVFRPGLGAEKLAALGKDTQ